MKPYENQTMKLNVTSTIPQYTNSQTSRGVSPHYVHTVVQGYLPGNAAMTYTIIDEDHLITKHGVQELSIRPLNTQELEDLKKQPTTSQWYNPSIQVYKTQWPLDVTEYFNHTDWKHALNQWITEGLVKDERLVNTFKSLIIPLTGNPLTVQPLNAHTMIVTNTGTGKSFMAYLYGGKPIVNPTEAGAIGSYNQTRTGSTIIHGFLHGEGFPVLLDEINTSNNPIIQHLLTYLESGILIRGLKHPIELHGTKTVILTGNPSTANDMIPSIVDFLRIVCTVESPDRVGRRIGFLLLGMDYQRVQGTSNHKNRYEVRQVIETTIKQYRHIIDNMIQDQMPWIRAPEPTIVQEIQEYADFIHNRVASDFVRGQSYGCIQKLKTATIRYIILEQLDRVPHDGLDFSDRDTVFQMLMDINRDSWKKLIVTFPLGMTDKEFVQHARREHPSLSLRQLEGITGYSHTTIRNWLKETEDDTQ